MKPVKECLLSRKIQNTKYKNTKQTDFSIQTRDTKRGAHFISYPDLRLTKPLAFGLVDKRSGYGISVDLHTKPWM